MSGELGLVVLLLSVMYKERDTRQLRHHFYILVYSCILKGK